MFDMIHIILLNNLRFIKKLYLVFHYKTPSPQIIQIQISILRIYFELRAEGGRPPLAEVVLEGREGILLESSLRRAQTPLHKN